MRAVCESSNRISARIPCTAKHIDQAPAHQATCSLKGTAAELTKPAPKPTRMKDQIREVENTKNTPATRIRIDQKSKKVIANWRVLAKYTPETRKAPSMRCFSFCRFGLVRVGYCNRVGDGLRCRGGFKFPGNPRIRATWLSLCGCSVVGLPAREKLCESQSSQHRKGAYHEALRAMLASHGRWPKNQDYPG